MNKTEAIQLANSTRPSKREWHRWFAWYPVELDWEDYHKNKKWVCWRYVERRYYYNGFWNFRTWLPSYKPIGEKNWLDYIDEDRKRLGAEGW